MKFILCMYRPNLIHCMYVKKEIDIFFILKVYLGLDFLDFGFQFSVEVEQFGGVYIFIFTDNGRKVVYFVT